MSALTLYHLGADYLALDALLAEAEEAGTDLESPEVVEIVTRWFLSLDGALEAKATRVVAVIREEAAKADVVDGEVQRLRKLASSRRGRVERLKDALHAAMVLARTKRIDTALGVVSLAGNGGKVPVVVDAVDPVAVAAEHPELTVTTTFIDTDAVRSALVAGVDLPFARLAPRGEHIRIR